MTGFSAVLTLVPSMEVSMVPSIALDIDPNVVKPGWTPLLITLGLAAVMVLLYRSMRRQFGRIQMPPKDERSIPPLDQDERPADQARGQFDQDEQQPETSGHPVGSTGSANDHPSG